MLHSRECSVREELVLLNRLAQEAEVGSREALGPGLDATGNGESSKALEQRSDTSRKKLHRLNGARQSPEESHRDDQRADNRPVEGDRE